MEDSELLKLLYIQNPWWEGRGVSVPKGKRRDFYKLKNALQEKQINAIIGPRRVGKSVLMKQLIEYLIAEKTPPKNILFAQLDEKAFEREKEGLINHIMEVYSKYVINTAFPDLAEKVYVFLDEVQHVNEWSDYLKSYYDREYKLKFVVSGSSAAGITKGSSDSLAGRISLHIVLTLKFADFLKFKGFEDELEDTSLSLRSELRNALDAKRPELLDKALREHYLKLVPKHARIEQLLSEYMIKGGYIELIEEKDYSKCLQYLKDLIQLVIYRDIVKVFDIRNPTNMEDLLQYLGAYSAQQFSENNLAEKLKMKPHTVGEYIDYLEDVYLISTCQIFAKSRAKQLRNPKKAYISDSGVRNMLNGTLSPKALTDSRDVGLMAETLVHNHLTRLAFFLDSYNSKCYYWKNGNEIDNIIYYRKNAIPVEVKYQNDIKSEDAQNCRKFVAEYASPFAVIVTKNKLDFKNGVLFIPLWYFLLMC